MSVSQALSYHVDMTDDNEAIVLCSDCFSDEGLRVGALALGTDDSSPCPNCRTSNSRKLTRTAAMQLAHQFYTWGSLQRGLFGGAPELTFNENRKTNVLFASWAGNDAELIEKVLNIGIFLYGPRSWMRGNITPLIDLQYLTSRDQVIRRIIQEYPSVELTPADKFYRLRRAPQVETAFSEYDSPPSAITPDGRLESSTLGVFYASKDIETCIHECRLTVQDSAFVATLRPSRSLRLLNLAHILRQTDVDEHESLDLAVHMLFLAGRDAYPISRDLAHAVFNAGFDGMIYPSFFSLVRTGAFPFPTTMGISLRAFPELEEAMRGQIVENIALFGWPIAEGKASIQCLNRLTLAKVDYGIVLGPVGFSYMSKADGIPNEQ